MSVEFKCEKFYTKKDEISGLLWLSINMKDISDISEIKGLENLTNLEGLSLSSNQITEIKGLKNMINLQNLTLNKNQISEIKGLENLTNLEVLSLSSNQITEIKGLEKLVNLKTLLIHENQISEIKGLENLTNLRSLWLCDNKITEIKGFENLINLRELWFENNQVTELKGLENLKNLKTLYLKNNKITEVKGLGNLDKLIWLDLYKNPVYKWGMKKFGDSDFHAFEEHQIPYIIAYCREIEEKLDKNSKSSMIDTSALIKFLLNYLESKVNDDFAKESYEAFEAESPPIGYISIVNINSWLWVKSRVNYRGGRWNPSTDRVRGDRYEAHDWRDWIGLADSAPIKVSQPEELDEWALLATTYLREYTDTGNWGRHKGSWVSELQADGTVTIFMAEGVFHDVSPEKATQVKQVKLKQ